MDKHHMLAKQNPALMDKTISHIERYFKKTGVPPTIVQIAVGVGVTREFAEAALKMWTEIGA